MIQGRTCIAVRNNTRSTVLCPRVTVADTTLTRLFGLLGKKRLDPGTGLLIKPSSGVHTWGMAFAIDIVALDENQVVLGAWRSVGPWRFCGLGFKTCSVLELAPGAVDDSGTVIGDQLEVCATPAEGEHAGR